CEVSNAHQWRTGNLESRRGAIRRRAVQISLAPAGFTLGKGAGLWSWVWLNMAKRKETAGRRTGRRRVVKIGADWGRTGDIAHLGAVASISLLLRLVKNLCEGGMG